MSKNRFNVRNMLDLSNVPIADSMSNNDSARPADISACITNMRFAVGFMSFDSNLVVAASCVIMVQLIFCKDNETIVDTLSIIKNIVYLHWVCRGSLQYACSTQEKLFIMDVSEEKKVELQDIVDQLSALVQSDEDVRQEVAKLKSQFYKTLEQKASEEKARWVEDGGKEEEFVYTPAEEQEFKSLLEQYRVKRNMLAANREAMFEKAFEIKSSILKKLKEIVEHLDEKEINFQEVRQLQQQWKDAGQVAPDKYKDLIKQYQAYMDKFYDYAKINHELRNLDFKKNLEAKTELCEKAEALINMDKVNEAFQQLQKLHAEWKELGPVAPEVREELWQRFKAATDAVNKKHANFYKNKKEQEEENLRKKTELCEKVESIDYKNASTFKQWDDVSEKVKAIQSEWKTLGFAPKKDNNKIYERFRATCDEIFKAKSEFYKAIKARSASNLEQKKELCRQAEELQDSTDWKATTDKMIKLQQEWKKVGPVSGKVSDHVWKRFIAACDHFFEEKNKHFKENGGVKNVLKERDKLIKRYEALAADIKTRENNLGFLNYDPANPNPLVAGMLKNIAKLKQDKENILSKIKEIETTLNSDEEQ